MDAEACRAVDDQWCSQFGLTIDELRDGGVRFVVDDDGANDAMSFRLGSLCVVVVRSDDLSRARALARGHRVDEVFTTNYLQRVLGPHARVDGPSWHGYVTARTFHGHPRSRRRSPRPGRRRPRLVAAPVRPGSVGRERPPA